MSSPFLAEIRIFPFAFAPKGWAWCDGQLMPISQNTALFALLGTVYGGDGKSSFGLPPLKGRAPMPPGQTQGGPEHFLGEPGGTETVTLLQSEMPIHTHTLMASAQTGDNNAPGPNVSLARSNQATAYQTTSSQNLVPMAPQAVSPAGGGLPHNNLQPYLTLNFCIALQGVFPQRP